MKQIVITLGAIFLLDNLVFGLVLDSFDMFNVLMSSSGTIVFTTAVLMFLELIKMKECLDITISENSDALSAHYWKGDENGVCLHHDAELICRVILFTLFCVSSIGVFAVPSIFALFWGK